MKGKRGITLIALIITVIVLLILAGVTISMVVGDNGVLTQAQKAKIKTDEVSAKEEVEIEIAGSYDDEGNLDFDLLNKNLMNNLKDLKLKVKDEYQQIDDINRIESLPATVYYKQTEVKIKELISNVAKNPENYGKYVDYPIDINGDGRTEKDWMIFYEDDEGNVFLKASDYVVAGGDNKCKELVESMEKAGMTNSDNSVYSAKWGVPPDEKAIYDDKCKLNSSLFKYNYCNNGLGCNLEKNNNPNAKCVKTLLNPTNWESFVSGNANKYGRCAIGSPTLDMWINSWNQHSDKENYPVLYCNSYNDNGYCIEKGENDESNTIDKAGVILNQLNDLLYFPHNSEFENCYGYWLAAPSSCGNSYLVRVSCRGYFGGSSNAHVSYFSNINLSLCPVICLKDGINVVLGELEESDGTITEYYELVQ